MVNRRPRQPSRSASSATRRSWRDGKRQRLERLVNRFIFGLVTTADARAAARRRREEQEREWEERRRLEAEQARLRAEEEQRIRLLEEDLVGGAAAGKSGSTSPRCGPARTLDA